MAGQPRDSGGQNYPNPLDAASGFNTTIPFVTSAVTMRGISSRGIHFFKAMGKCCRKFFCIGALGLVASPLHAQDWTRIGSLPSVPTSGFFFDTKSGLVASNSSTVGRQPAIFKTTDGGDTWTSVTLPVDLQGLQGFGEFISSIYMHDRMNGWFSYHGYPPYPFSPYTPGIYRTSDGGNTWNALDSSQYNCVKSEGGTLYVSDGGIAQLNDSVCMISGGAAPAKPVGQGAYVQWQTYVTTNAGKSWTTTPLVEESWGIYVQQATGIFFLYPEGIGTISSKTIDSSQLWYSLDTGRNWIAGATIPNLSSFYSTSGDIEGDGNAIYIQSTEKGMFRSMDQGQSWKSVGGPSNLIDTRFCVLPSCNGGTVIAFDAAGGIWLTTDGGDGTLGDPIPTGDILSADTSHLTSSCGGTRIPVPMQGQAIDSIFIHASIAADSLRQFSITSANNILLRGGDNDTLWIDYSPHSTPSTSTLTLNFQNSWHCSDWAETRTIIVTTPPSALAIAPQPITGSCKVLADSGFVQIDSCQLLVITNVRVPPSIANRLQFQYSLPDTIRNGYHNTLPFTFDPRDTAANGTVPIELTGYYFGTSVRFDTTFNVYVAAIPGLPNLTSSLSSVAFGAVKMCANFAARDTFVTFTNSGCAPDTITQITVTGAGFTGGNDTLPIIVAPGDSVTFNYRFVPPDSGAFTGEARLNVSSMGLTENPAIALAGKGVQGFGILDVRSTALQAGSFSFCAGDTTVFDTISNKGCDTLVISNIVFTGDAAFSLTSPLHDTLLLPYDSAIIQFYFAPRTKGAHAATLSFHSQNIVNDSGRDTAITLAGLGLGGTTELFADTATRNFGALYACETRDTTITLYNTGCDTLYVDSSYLSNGTYAAVGTYPLRILPKDSTTVHVLLTGDTSGMNGSLEFFSDANVGSKTARIPLSASIIQPASLHLSLVQGRDVLRTSSSGDVDTFYLVLTGQDVRSTSLQNITFDLTHNDDLLTFVHASGVGLQHSRLAGTPASTRDSFAWVVPSPAPPPLDTIGTLTFQVYLTDSTSTPLTLSNISFTNSLKLPNDCVASIDDASSGFTYNFRCGEQMIQDAMAGVPFTITSIVPNPAQDEITVEVAAVGDLHAISYEMYDALGTGVLGTTPQPPPLVRGGGVTLDVSDVPSGLYFLRLSEGGYAQSRSVVVEH